MILVEVHLDGENRGTESRDEMFALVLGTGGEVAGVVTQRRRAADPGFFVGRGKVGEISELARELDVSTLVFDHNLTPGQVAKLEESTGCKVLDRTELILAIFASQARTREARLQIELAQLTYALPRLTRMWHHLSRLGAGIGTRGPGETQLEVDRRRARTRIGTLRRQLDGIDRQWQVRAERRRSRMLYQVTLVGYTNSGKSTLMNALSNSGVLTADRPFATLDTTSRRLDLEGVGGSIILSDTVGFIERLPETLVASFRTTLGVVREADLLLVVSDMTCPDRDHKLRVVEETLDRIGASDIPRIIVWNKSDLRGDDPLPSSGVSVSALRRGGLGTLRNRIRTYWASSLEWFELTAGFPLAPAVENWLRENCYLEKLDAASGEVRVLGGIRPGIGKLKARLESEGLRDYRLAPVRRDEEPGGDPSCREGE